MAQNNDHLTKLLHQQLGIGQNSGNTNQMPFSPPTPQTSTRVDVQALFATAGGPPPPHFYPPPGLPMGIPPQMRMAPPQVPVPGAWNNPMPLPTNLLQDPRTGAFHTPPTTPPIINSPLLAPKTAEDNTSTTSTPTQNHTIINNNNNKSAIQNVVHHGQSKGGEEIGHALMSQHVVYEMNKDSGKFKELEVTPITLYSSEYSYLSGNLIGVNKSYICYTVRGDMVRVLNRKSASRGLLKGHTSSIQDIQFQDEDSDILITCAKDSTFYIWKLDTQDSSTIGHQVLFSKNTGEGNLIRAQWNPIAKEIVAIANSSGFIYIVNISSLDFPIIELSLSSNIKDISFSTSDVSIIGIATDHDVQFWNWKSKQLVSKYQPHDKNSITSIVFVPGLSNNSSYLLTGANNNSELKLWNLKTEQCLQSINFGTEVHNNHTTIVSNRISFDPTGTYLLVTNTKDKNICVLHLAKNRDNRVLKFNYIAEFSLAYPIISFMVTNAENDSLTSPSSPSSSSSALSTSPQNSIQMQMFCVQTKAIQLYHIYSSNCHPPLDTLSLPDDVEDQVPTVDADSVSVTSPQLPPSLQPPQVNDQVEETKPIIENLLEPIVSNITTTPTITTTSIEESDFEDKSANEEARSVSGNTVDTEVSIPVVSGEEEELLTPLSFASIMNENNNNINEETHNIIEEQEEETHTSTDESGSSNSKSIKKDSKKSPGKNKNRKKNKTPAVSSILTRPPPGSIVPDSHLPLLPIVSDIQDSTTPSTPILEPTHNKKKEKEKVSTKEEFEDDTFANIISNSGNVDMNLLLSLFKKMEQSIVSKNEKNFTSQMDKVYNKMEKERMERDKLERERLEKILTYVNNSLNASLPQHLETIIHKELQNVIVPAIAKSLVQTLENNLLKPLQENIKKMILQSFAPKIESIVKDSISKVVMNKQISSDLSKAVTSNMKAPIQEAFAAVFQETLVPSIEGSTQVMFRQIANAFDKGLQDKLAPSENEARKMEALTQQIKYSIESLNEITTNLTRNMIDTQTRLFYEFSDRISKLPPSEGTKTTPIEQQQQQQANRPPASNAPTPTLTVNHLNKLVQENKFDEAFSAALTARNIELITWLCGRIDPALLFQSQPQPLLSQHVLLALTQQLGVDVTKDTILKVAWLREATLALNFKDKVVADHGPTILQKLLRNLEEHFPKFSSNANIATPYKLLIHVVRSLLK